LKILLTILPFFFCLHLAAQYNGKGLYENYFDSALSVKLQTQWTKPVKWYTVTQTEGIIMTMFFAGGYLQGWRDELLYHPHALLDRFGLQDEPYWNDKKEKGFLNMQWDFDHNSKSGIVLLAVTSVALRGWNIWRGKRVFHPRTFWIFLGRMAYEMTLNYSSYKFGHMLAYNLTHGNKL
jgi:hypothetical protein